MSPSERADVGRSTLFVADRVPVSLGLLRIDLHLWWVAPFRPALGERHVDAGIPLRQLTDHGTHLAVYLSDPDGNDLELAWDRPFDEWRRYGSDEAPPNDGRLDLDELLSYRS